MKKLLLSFSISLFISSCGPNKRTNSEGGDCGYEVVHDHNDVALACNYISSEQKALSCKPKAQSFLDKYPNINCKVEKSNDHSVDPDIVTITPSTFQNIIKKLENRG